MRGWKYNAPNRCRSRLRLALRDSAHTSLRSGRRMGEHQCVKVARHEGDHQWRATTWTEET